MRVACALAGGTRFVCFYEINTFCLSFPFCCLLVLVLRIGCVLRLPLGLVIGLLLFTLEERHCKLLLYFYSACLVIIVLVVIFSVGSLRWAW